MALIFFKKETKNVTSSSQKNGAWFLPTRRTFTQLREAGLGNLGTFSQENKTN